MRTRLAELAALFLKLGTIGFGGPAVHIATMEEEVVERRRWMSHEHFLDLVGATHLIPGPNSTEMAIHIGYHRAGLRGMLVAGTCFIVPAVLITVGFAWAYDRFGQLPDVKPILFGIKPAVLVVIVAAAWRLGRKAIRSPQLAVIALAVAVASLFGDYLILALLAGSLVGMLWLRWSERGGTSGTGAALLLGFGGHDAASAKPAAALSAVVAGTAASVSTSPPLWKLALFFLKTGAVLYGSGYVLVAYLRGGIQPGGMLDGYLSEAQLIDAIAVGQFTPGPILSAAAFVGYLVAGISGAVVASVAIFLPSFVLVAAINPLIPRLRRSPWTSAFLDAVVAASIGLLAVAALALASSSLLDPDIYHIRWSGVLIAVVAAILAFRYDTRPAWLVLGGAAAGWLLSLMP